MARLMIKTTIETIEYNRLRIETMYYKSCLYYLYCRLKMNFEF